MNADRPDPTPPEEPDHRLDVDAAFAEIVARWEPSPPEQPPVDREPVREPEPAPEDPSPPPGDPQALRDLFRPGWKEEPLSSEASWDDEGHFVPPPPPPLPTVEPRRKLAWGALVAAPLVALLALVLGLRPPGWLAVGLVLGFVGGFVYLVATMRASADDGWPGDDGAVL